MYFFKNCSWKGVFNLPNENLLAEIKLIANKNLKNNNIDFLNPEKMKGVKKFHSSIRGYKPTPLHNLKNLANYLGVKNIYIKDESYRFNLNSFKSLGGSYAIAKILAEKLGKDIKKISFDYLKSENVKNKLGKLTFTTATDGNHGRGVAWAASKLGHQAVIYLPKNSAKHRVKAIEALGAKAIVTNLDYDDTVDFVLQKAEAENWILVQDTARTEYLKIPHWIMQGYTTMVQEVELQLELEALEKPTHLFLQAGVGSMAAAILGYYQNINDKNPITTIIEPKEAACLYESAAAADSKAHKASGNLKTDMAGLACGEANPIAWNILRDYADFFISCSDYPAARAMRILANPIAEDDRIISGESGAVGLGVLALLMEKKKLKSLKEKLQLDQNSTLLFFNTEGATDKVNYRKIVWDGKHSLLD